MRILFLEGVVSFHEEQFIIDKYNKFSSVEDQKVTFLVNGNSTELCTIQILRR